MVEDTAIVQNRSITMEVILVRDQRTTSHRVLDRAALQRSYAPTSTMLLRRAEPEDNASSLYTEVTARTDVNDRRHLRCDSYFMPTFYDRGIQLCCNLITTTTWLSLGCFLVILFVTSARGAPMADNGKSWRWSIPPKWVNPCGLTAVDFNGDVEVVQLQDKQLVSQIVVQAKTALMHTESFRDSYIKDAFSTDLNGVQSAWRNRYDWLPRMPKKLGEPLKKEYLDKLKLDAVLLDAYQNMQKFAVTLEQIVWDRADQNLPFLSDFKDTEFKLRTVLCELQVALVERGVPLREDIDRSIMPDNIRKLGQTGTFHNLRDWLIFRDYINALEYLVQVFEYLYRELES